MFVAVASSGVGSRVMTSPDGCTGALHTAAADRNWVSVTHGNGTFVAVGAGAAMTSAYGTSWNSQTAANNTTWKAVTFGTAFLLPLPH